MPTLICAALLSLLAGGASGCSLCTGEQVLNGMTTAGENRGAPYTCMEAEVWLNSHAATMDCATGQNFWGATCCASPSKSSSLLSCDPEEGIEYTGNPCGCHPSTPGGEDSIARSQSGLYLWTGGLESAEACSDLCASLDQPFYTFTAIQPGFCNGHFICIENTRFSTSCTCKTDDNGRQTAPGGVRGAGPATFTSGHSCRSPPASPSPPPPSPRLPPASLSLPTTVALPNVSLAAAGSEPPSPRALLASEPPSGQCDPKPDHGSIGTTSMGTTTFPVTCDFAVKSAVAAGTTANLACKAFAALTLSELQERYRAQPATSDFTLTLFDGFDDDAMHVIDLCETTCYEYGVGRCFDKPAPITLILAVGLAVLVLVVVVVCVLKKKKCCCLRAKPKALLGEVTPAAAVSMTDSTAGNPYTRQLE